MELSRVKQLSKCYQTFMRKLTSEKKVLRRHDRERLYWAGGQEGGKAPWALGVGGSEGGEKRRKEERKKGRRDKLKI